MDPREPVVAVALPPEPMDSGCGRPGLFSKEVVCGPGAGCRWVVERPWGAAAGGTPPTGFRCPDPAFDRAAFARCSASAVRRILSLVPLDRALALSLRRIALRRVTLGDDGGAPLRWTGISDGDGGVEGENTGARQRVTRCRMLMAPRGSGLDKGCMDFC
ncbi:MAG TPA: hypothetical protein DD643_03010 [Synechococcus sp. UBA8638]|nr:hypothetical protein [Synechococcus sp. UBA8638]